MKARSIPIIQLKDYLIVSIQIELSDRLVMELKENVSWEIVERDVTGIIIEVSGVDVFDSYIASSVRDIAFVARLMGVETVLVGLDPAMAITLVEMGMELTGLRTALNLDMAVEELGRLRDSTSVSDDALVREILRDASREEAPALGLEVVDAKER